MPQNVDIMRRTGISCINVNEKSIMDHDDSVIEAVNVFLPLNQFACNGFSYGLRICTRVPSINPMQPGKSGTRVASCARTVAVGHLISFAAAVLMQLLTKMASSLEDVLDQFHWADSNVAALSYFRYMTKLNKGCSGINFGGLPESVLWRHLDRAIEEITGHMI